MKKKNNLLKWGSIIIILAATWIISGMLAYNAYDKSQTALYCIAGAGIAVTMITILIWNYYWMKKEDIWNVVQQREPDFSDPELMDVDRPAPFVYHNSILCIQQKLSITEVKARDIYWVHLRPGGRRLRGVYYHVELYCRGDIMIPFEVEDLFTADLKETFDNIVKQNPDNQIIFSYGRFSGSVKIPRLEYERRLLADQNI